MRRTILWFSFFLMLSSWWATSTPVTPEWRPLEPGIELLVLDARRPSPVGDSKITVIRFDPGRWRLVFIGKSNTGERRGHTAREWCKRYHLTAAINAGMFNPDYKTHTGFLQAHSHTNNPEINGYKSVVAFDPKRRGIPPFRIFDLDVPGVTIKTILNDYMVVIQNLRLIKRPGKNRWHPQKKMWSEAALGEDVKGRILFIFSRSPFAMYDLNEELLSAGIGIVAAQHLEGGPEAQLYVKAGDTELELFGIYETGFLESGKNGEAWPIPNILGIQPFSKEE